MFSNNVIKLSKINIKLKLNMNAYQGNVNDIFCVGNSLLAL